jgi:hypothetical protein
VAPPLVYVVIIPRADRSVWSVISAFGHRGRSVRYIMRARTKSAWILSGRPALCFRFSEPPFSGGRRGLVEHALWSVGTYRPHSCLDGSARPSVRPQSWSANPVHVPHGMEWNGMKCNARLMCPAVLVTYWIHHLVYWKLLKEKIQIITPFKFGAIFFFK